MVKYRTAPNPHPMTQAQMKRFLTKGNALQVDVHDHYHLVICGGQARKVKKGTGRTMVSMAKDMQNIKDITIHMKKEF